MPFVRGHARSMKAIHGGQAQTERIDAHKIAVLLRGGMLPQAYVDPAEMRATRHLLRRRMPLMRHRAGLRAPIPNTPSQYNLPQIGTTLAYKANRGGGAERLSEPAVQQSRAVDLTRIGSYARRRTALALELVTTAQGPGAQTVSRRRSSPGVGNILALVLLYASHDLHRFPRVQEVGSYGRLLKCAKESAGKRSGPAGAQIGTADRTGAFSEAAVLFWRNQPAGPKDLARLANTHGTGNAWTGLAPTRARAVDDMLRRDPAVDLDKFCSESGRGTREPDASLAAEGIRLRNVLWQG